MIKFQIPNSKIQINPNKQYSNQKPGRTTGMIRAKDDLRLETNLINRYLPHRAVWKLKFGF